VYSDWEDVTSAAMVTLDKEASSTSEILGFVERSLREREVGLPVTQSTASKHQRIHNN